VSHQRKPKKPEVFVSNRHSSATRRPLIIPCNKMDTANLISVGRLSLALFLIAGGVFALHRGFLTFKTASEPNASTDLKFGNLTISAKSLGAVVMATASFWGFLGYVTAPTMKKDGDSMTISQFQDELRQIHPQNDVNEQLRQQLLTAIAKSDAVEKNLHSIEVALKNHNSEIQKSLTSLADLQNPDFLVDAVASSLLNRFADKLPPDLTAGSDPSNPSKLPWRPTFVWPKQTDSIDSIAAKYHVKPEELQALNPQWFSGKKYVKLPAEKE
jgi:hypothetical protein